MSYTTITIRFNRSSKDYLYLLDNPDNIDITKIDKMVKIISGTSYDREIFSIAELIKIEHCEKIPPVIKTKLTLKDGNRLFPLPLSDDIISHEENEDSVEIKAKKEIAESLKRIWPILEAQQKMTDSWGEWFH